MSNSPKAKKIWGGADLSAIITPPKKTINKWYTDHHVKYVNVNNHYILLMYRIV